MSPSATLASIDDLETAIKIAPNAAAYRRLENEVRRALADAWNVRLDQVMEEIEKRIGRYVPAGGVSSPEVEALVARMMGRELQLVPGLRARLLRAADDLSTLGKSEVTRRALGRFASSSLDNRMREWFADTTLHYAGRFVLLKHYADPDRREERISLAQRIGRRAGKLSFEQGLGLREQGRMLSATIGEELGYGPMGPYYFEVVASNTCIYQRNMAQTVQLQAEGVETVVWYTMGDERVCPLCGPMHGKVFKVRESVRIMEAVLAVREPDDIRQVSPWLQLDGASEWVDKNGAMRKGQAFFQRPGEPRTYLGDRATDGNYLQEQGIGLGQLHGG